jgi:hypothetical protein
MDNTKERPKVRIGSKEIVIYIFPKIRKCEIFAGLSVHFFETIIIIDHEYFDPIKKPFHENRYRQSGWLCTRWGEIAQSLNFKYLYKSHCKFNELL